MAHEHDNLSAILEKMDKIANERYEGATEDNAYSIFMQLTDMERIKFTRYSYRFIKAINSAIEINCNCPESGKPIKTPYDDDAKLEVTDKKELVRLKHKAIVGVGQVFVGALSILIIGILLLSFISPEALKMMGSIGNVLGTIAGG